MKKTIVNKLRTVAASSAAVAVICGICAAAAPEVTTRNVTGNTAPIAENIELTTYRGIAVAGQFAATDPDGDAVAFTVCTEPQKGSVELTGDRTFLYTPADGKKGADSFTYTATDSEGNVSSPAAVTVRIKKQSTDVSYSDMDGNPAQYAATSLAECGIFTGDRIGSEYFFRPEEQVTRAEFLAMCIALSNEDLITGVTRTAFSDDADTAAWAKPYISTGVMAGIVRGSRTVDGSLVFNPDAPVTFAEAAVMLNNALGITDVVSVFSAESESAAAWADQSAANLRSCGIVGDDIASLYGDTLTRQDAALMLSSAMGVAERRGGSSLLGWAG